MTADLLLDILMKFKLVHLCLFFLFNVRRALAYFLIAYFPPYDKYICVYFYFFIFTPPTRLTWRGRVLRGVPKNTSFFRDTSSLLLYILFIHYCLLRPKNVVQSSFITIHLSY